MRGRGFGSRTVELVLEDVKEEPGPTDFDAFPISLDIVCAQGHEDLYEAAFDGIFSNPTVAMLSRLAPRPELRFRPPGLARTKELRGALSTVLGRAFARAFLYQYYDFTWFAPMERLLHSTFRGYKARRTRSGGNTPDWLAGTANSRVKAEIVEAKGIHRRTVSRDSALLPPWRRQLQNVTITKNSQRQSLKGWIIATRWVTTDEPRRTPRMYVEDPRTPGEVEPTPEDTKTLVEWAAREHIAHYLARTDQADLSLRVIKEDTPRYTSPIWKVQRENTQAFAGLEFVGRIRPANPWELAPWWASPHADPRSPFFGLVFEGIEVGIVEDALRQKLPRTERLQRRDIETKGELLRDGTVVVPASDVVRVQERVIE